MNDEEESKIHPAKLWPARWFWHDRSEQPENIQIIDLLTDIRSLVFIWIILWIIF